MEREFSDPGSRIQSLNLLSERTEDEIEDEVCETCGLWGQTIVLLDC